MRFCTCVVPVYTMRTISHDTGGNTTDFIHLRAKTDKSHLKIQELSQNQRDPRSKAFKVSVPKGKLQTLIKLPWDSTVKAQPFKAKPFGSATGTARKQANRPFQRHAPPFNRQQHRHPGSYNRRQSYWDYQSPEWDEWGYPLHY